MKLSNIVTELDLEIVAGYNLENENNEPQGVYICDLLSLVMGKAKEHDIWITIQTHVNIVAVASLVDITAIIVSEGIEIDEDTKAKASEVNIPIFRSNLSSYDLATKLNSLGV
ncbi:DRTGG domain-containing protein [Sporosalibacterium faouarense]|uniref:DRTGG domain-containing protein n=1 Tax=Sporosalibacterium faouarense TaxID=516123 RepID=UPI00141C0FE4|nr:DRTGG domain-containing protein [Sporosalibacterium faouarense]MTI48556.1 serine kinase [Bacillota bacterium]